MKDKTFRPNWISAPGDSINEILKDKGITLARFALQLSESIETVNDLIKGQLEINQELAQKLEIAIGATAEFWIAREKKYREELKTYQGNEQFLETLPLKEMIEFGWIKPTSNRQDLITNCLNFFQTPNSKVWFEKHRDTIETAAFRTSPTFQSKSGSVAAWLRQGEIIAETIKCKEWNPERFKDKLSDIRLLTREDNPNKFLPKLLEMCAECGIAFVLLKAPFYCKASGATRFISENKAMLLMSYRYFVDDHFWFTFFHEAGHILLHNRNALFVDETATSHIDEEKEANTFASEILIPTEFRSEFLNLRANKKDVIRFARRIGISRGIVVGQLQHLGILKRNELSGLKKSFAHNY